MNNNNFKGRNDVIKYRCKFDFGNSSANNRWFFSLIKTLYKVNQQYGTTKKIIEAFKLQLSKTKEPKYQDLIQKKIKLAKFKLTVGYTEQRSELIDFYYNPGHSLSPEEFRIVRYFLKFDNKKFKGLDKLLFFGIIASALFFMFLTYIGIEKSLSQHQYYYLPIYIFNIAFYFNILFKLRASFKSYKAIKHLVTSNSQ